MRHCVPGMSLGVGDGWECGNGEVVGPSPLRRVPGVRPPGVPCVGSRRPSAASVAICGAGCLCLRHPADFAEAPMATPRCGAGCRRQPFAFRHPAGAARGPVTSRRCPRPRHPAGAARRPVTPPAAAPGPVAPRCRVGCPSSAPAPVGVLRIHGARRSARTRRPGRVLPGLSPTLARAAVPCPHPWPLPYWPRAPGARGVPGCSPATARGRSRSTRPSVRRASSASVRVAAPSLVPGAAGGDDRRTGSEINIPVAAERRRPAILGALPNRARTPSGRTGPAAEGDVNLPVRRSEPNWMPKAAAVQTASHAIPASPLSA